jgi:membrane associated rhomboid family serine protease
MADIIKLSDRPSRGPQEPERPRFEGPPVFNVPPVVLAVLAVLVAIHLLRILLPVDAGNWLLEVLGFFPLRYTGAQTTLAGGSIAAGTSFLTHGLLHSDVMHLTFNGMWLLIFATPVARRIQPVRFLAFLAVSTISGAVAYLLMNLGEPSVVIGISGGDAGLMAACMRFYFNASGGLTQMRDRPASVPLTPLREVLVHKQILAVSGIYILLNLLASIGIGTPGGEGGLAWEAHIGGFLGGLLLYGWFDGAPQKKLPRPTLH